MFTKNGVVLSDSRKFLTGVTKVIFTEVDVNVAQHIAVPKRAFFTLPDENSVAVLVNCHKRPEPVAKLAFDCIIKSKLVSSTTTSQSLQQLSGQRFAMHLNFRSISGSSVS